MKEYIRLENIKVERSDALRPRVHHSVRYLLDSQIYSDRTFQSNGDAWTEAEKNCEVYNQTDKSLFCHPFGSVCDIFEVCKINIVSSDRDYAL